MARFPNTSSTESTDSPTSSSADNTETQESNSMSTDTVAEATSTESEVAEATDASTEAEAATEVVEPEPEVIDLTEFHAAVEVALAQGDESTGDIPVAAVAPVTKAYQALSVAGKSRSKSEITELMKTSILARESNKAIGLLQLQNAMTPAKSSGSRTPAEPKAPADPNEAPATQLAILKSAFVHLNGNLPEGADRDAVAAKTTELVDATAAELQGYLDWINRDEPAEGEADLDEPEVSNVTKKAAKLVLSKVRVSTSTGSGQTYSGPRRNVLTHIEQVFADKPSGSFMSINEIATAKSDEYGDDKVSSGAVTARAFPTDNKVNLPGFTPTSQDGKRGLVKN